MIYIRIRHWKETYSWARLRGRTADHPHHPIWPKLGASNIPSLQEVTFLMNIENVNFGPATPLPKEFPEEAVLKTQMYYLQTFFKFRKCFSLGLVLEFLRELPACPLGLDVSLPAVVNRPKSDDTCVSFSQRQMWKVEAPGRWSDLRLQKKRARILITKKKPSLTLE